MKTFKEYFLSGGNKTLIESEPDNGFGELINNIDKNLKKIQWLGYHRNRNLKNVKVSKESSSFELDVSSDIYGQPMINKSEFIRLFEIYRDDVELLKNKSIWVRVSFNYPKYDRQGRIAGPNKVFYSFSINKFVGEPEGTELFNVEVK